MNMTSALVGTALSPYVREVDWRDTTNYAAGIGDLNPAYFDDAAAGGIVAPPLFAAAVTWPVTARMGDYITAPDFPRALLITQVHYTEHLRFDRPIAPGDRLTVRGRIAAIVPHRAGTHVTVRYLAEDAQGRPVFTEHVGAMLRGVDCKDAGRGGEHLPVEAEVAVSRPPAWEAPLFLDPLLTYVYDACSRIHFPIHTSPRFAKAVGLPGIIVQGTAVLALAAREMLNREAGGDPARLKTISCRFSGMALPGTTLTLQLSGRREPSDGRDLSFKVLNPDGRPVIRKGRVHIAGD